MIAYIKGFRVVGKIPSSRLFRAVRKPHAERITKEALLSSGVEAWIDEVISEGRNSEGDETLLKLSLEDVDDGFATGLFTKKQVDGIFGKGKWCPSKRFLLTDASGKPRVIDDTNRSWVNEFTDVLETIFTISVDHVPLAIKEVITQYLLKWHPRMMKLACSAILPFLPEGYQPVVGLSDEKHAFREVPIDPQDADVAVIAVWDHRVQRTMFLIMKGHPYGFMSAVLNYNRLPTLAVAMGRRAFGVMNGSYFDDNTQVDLAWAMGSGKQCMHRIFRGVGSNLSEKKELPLGMYRVGLGGL